MAERRQRSRIRHRVVARFEAKGKQEIGIVLNFSEVGLFVQTRKLLPIGENVSFVLGSGKTSMTVEGKVIWRRSEPKVPNMATPSGMGIILYAASKEYMDFVDRMVQDRAKLPRGVEERFEAYHRVRFKSGAAFLTEYTENLSRGGMYLTTGQTLKPGATIRAQLEIPGLDEPIHVEGRVAYRLTPEAAQAAGRSAGVGVQFVKLSPNVKDKLNHYINRLEIHRGSPERRFTGIVPPSGLLSDFLVPELLFAGLQKKITGTLRVERQGVAKTVYLKNGHPIYVESSLWSESLGHYLVRQGKLSREDLEKSLKDLEKSDVFHGELLIVSGLVDSATLVDALVGHHEEKLSNTFAWFDGKYSLEPSTEWPNNVSIFPLRTYKIIFEGIERWYDQPLIGTWMGLHEKSSLKLKTMPSTDLHIPPRILRVLRHLATPHTIEELAAKLKMQTGQLLSTAFALVIAGWCDVDFAERSDEKPKEEKPVAAKPAPKAPPPMTAEAKKIMQTRIEQEFEHLRQQNFYGLLQVKPGVTDTELQRAFIKRTGQFTVRDVDQIEDVNVQEKARQIVAWFQLAYDTLRDPQLRQVYARSGDKKPSAGRRTEKLEAERLLLEGIRDMEQGNTRKAINCLSTAIKKYPNDPLIQGYLAWSLFKDNPKRNLKRASELLQKSLDCNVSDPQLYFYQGEIFSHLGNWYRAERYYSKALRLYPNFAKAAAAVENAKQKRIAEERMARQNT